MARFEQQLRKSRGEIENLLLDTGVKQISLQKDSEGRRFELHCIFLLDVAVVPKLLGRGVDSRVSVCRGWCSRMNLYAGREVTGH